MLYANFYLIYNNKSKKIIRVMMKMKRLTFKKGIHPKEFKQITENLEIKEVPVPPKIIIPIRQHIGAPLNPVVKKGDRVKTGQIIADSEAFVSAPVHSSCTGIVKNIGDYPTPLSPSDTCIEIETEEKEEFDFDLNSNIDYKSLSKQEILKLIRRAGIVGMGGAAFPAAVKFTPPKDIHIDTVILNGCECEPYLTSDYRTMLEFPEKILEGLKIIMRAAEAERGIIGIEDNKPDAIEKMSQLADNESKINVQAVKTKYPQGAEKMLVSALTGRKIPPGALPFSIGVVVSNVGTAAAIYDAVVKNIPLYKRVLTITGEVLENPANLLVRVGTPFSFLFDYIGGFSDEVTKLILGGPMMGIAQFTPDVGITKATSGILVMGKRRVGKEFNCINCAECVNHCPMFLVPTKIVRFAKSEIWDKAEDYGAMNCIECGSCSYMCPSNIPLVHWIRVAKSKITEIKKSSGK